MSGLQALHQSARLLELSILCLPHIEVPLHLPGQNETTDDQPLYFHSDLHKCDGRSLNGLQLASSAPQEQVLDSEDARRGAVRCTPTGTMGDVPFYNI